MDLSAIEGHELRSVTFIDDFLELGFGASALRFGGPVLTLYAWPYVMLPEFSVAFGEPEYRNALCAQIGEMVTSATLDEGSALTLELANAVVLGLSLREEDLDRPEAGSYSPTGSPNDAQEF